jgi:hypothetical protein
MTILKHYYISKGNLCGTMLDLYLQFMLQLEKHIAKKHYYIV